MVWNEKKKQCLPCSTGCKGCSKTDISACIGCVVGYYSENDSKGVARCKECFNYCDTCTSATACTKCETGYVLSTDKSKCTIKCSDNCATCDS